jgi:hypothetical protein
MEGGAAPFGGRMEALAARISGHRPRLLVKSKLANFCGHPRLKMEVSEMVSFRVPDPPEFRRQMVKLDQSERTSRDLLVSSGRATPQC